jgi:hypothetical protein
MRWLVGWLVDEGMEANESGATSTTQCIQPTPRTYRAAALSIDVTRLIQQDKHSAIE